MQIIVEIPEDIAQHPEPGREVLEALAIEGYRVGRFRTSKRAGYSGCHGSSLTGS